ncbi:P-loop NTPase fold protein [Actinotignum timonense]|uniref:P-loop NTPase fold protein n=1 Tax=Actinotignum timonense TaxID=1870995 RepID=UPI00254CCCDF|nr:P-loop NTPase fold protein [Actinotignum timonense]MDK8782529.1 P-loop NTPase fold protein [Actinotignum timonense]
MTDKEVGFNEELGFSDEPSPNDHLGMGSYIEGFSTYTTHCPTPMTAAIQGDWGSGKTTALWAIKKELQKPSKDDYWVIDFNTWQYSQFDLGEQLVFSLIKEIIDRITERVQALETANDSRLETKVEKIKAKGRRVLRFECVKLFVCEHCL